VNLLSHLLLSGPDPSLRLGNVLGDLVKGMIDGATRTDLPLAVLEGVRLHRRIDTFTDTHDIPRRSCLLITPEWRRYAGILVDVFYDHVLSRNWSRLHPEEPLEKFLAIAYRQFEDFDQSVLPPMFPVVIRRMIDGNWLGSYGTQAGIALTLRRMSRRLRRPVNLEAAAQQLPEIYDHLEQDFLEFWPQLVAEVRKTGFD
jgi:acyl carrier protein phosphodiesterase